MSDVTQMLEAAQRGDRAATDLPPLVDAKRAKFPSKQSSKK